MDILTPLKLKESWLVLAEKLERQFGERPDLQTVLFLIGVQELGKGYRTYSKDEKQDLMHIATCKLLSYWGHYELEGLDPEGWPIWKKTASIPRLTLQQQDQLLRHGALQYFLDTGYLNEAELSKGK